MASSTFPLASTRAFLQSRRPAPVWMRRSLTVFAVIGVLMSFSLHRRPAGAYRLLLRSQVGVHGRQVDRDVDLRKVHFTGGQVGRCRLADSLGGRLRVRTTLRAARVALGKAGLDRGDDRLDDDAHGLDRVV